MRTFSRRILKYSFVTSTFDKLLEFPPENGLVVVAEGQTQGVGRLGRQWQSEKGGLYFSFYSEADGQAEKLPFLAIICALAVHRALIRYAPCSIKWPNDIVSGGKKLCGILTKSTLCDSEAAYVMAGIGINVNNILFDESISERATSLKLLNGAEYDKDEILESFFDEFEDICENLSAEQIIKCYSEVCITLHSQVTIHYGDGRTINGVCKRICADGTIDVETENGVINVNSGEVSVRGVYGYV